MCGVYGIVSEGMDEAEIASRLEAMGRVQRHRGPDDIASRIYNLDRSKVGLGFTRLSILDLETGMQPIECPVDGTSIICNGEVYNYIELRTEVSEQPFRTRGDIEVALHLYRKMGPAFLDRLNGMYAGAILDPAKSRLLLFRDRFGIKPLYYCRTPDALYFSSEIRPFFEARAVRPELDRKLLPQLFTYRFVPGDHTLFKGIMRLPPGAFLDCSLTDGSFEMARYWDYAPGVHEAIRDENEAVERFFALLDDAVRIRLRSDVEVAGLISGGMDSSSVAYLAAGHQPGIRLFTISFAEEEYDELDMVREFIAHSGEQMREVRHIHRPCPIDSLELLPNLVKSLEECISLGTVIPTDQVCALASEHVKVALTGEGADEIFAGYRKFLLEAAAAEAAGMPSSKRKRLLEDLPELARYLAFSDLPPRQRYIRGEALFEPEELSKLLGLRTGIPALPQSAMPTLGPGMHPLDQALAMECRARLPDYVILRLDRLSMRHSLEARTPYLDYRLAEFAGALPVDMKVGLGRRMGKLICRESLYRNGVLDADTAFRTKQPFTIPMASWLTDRKNLPGFVTDAFLGSEAGCGGILEKDMVSGLWNELSSEGVGPETLVSSADRAFAVLMFTLWFREFIG